MKEKTQELRDFIVGILNEKKADHISAIEVADKTTLADYFILASANTPTHVKSLADEILYKLKEDYEVLPMGVEGIDTGRWVLIDLGTIIVHIMHRQDRDFYNLDKFWSGKEAEHISELDS